MRPWALSKGTEKRSGPWFGKTCKEAKEIIRFGKINRAEGKGWFGKIVSSAREFITAEGTIKFG